MIRAYREIYLNKAQSTLGDAFDYAVNVYNIAGENFVKMFLASSVSQGFENGDPKYIAGKSGIELVCEVVSETMGKFMGAISEDKHERSQEYWIGWAVAYYQWYSSRKFSDIFKAISYGDFEKMYYTLHEADISKFIDTVTERVNNYFRDTNLKRIRVTYGYSQAKLSLASGVSLRSIQMYEQRKKDINKASAETLYRLAKVLGCKMEDLIENNC